MQIIDASRSVHNEDSSIETTEKISTAPDQQDSDYDMEQFLNESQYIEDDIEIGEEIKPVIPANYIASSDDLPYSKFKLTYCPMCHKFKKYSPRKSKLCFKCKTILKYKCGKCMKVYSSITDLRSHLLQHFDVRPKHSCDKCDYKCYNKYNLAKHVQSKHLPRNLNINNCKKCAKNFSRSSSLKKHLKTCGASLEQRQRLPMRFFLCDHCQYKNNQKVNLIRHIQNNHFKIDVKLNKCITCNKSFTESAKLRLHSKFCGLTPELRRSLSKFSCDHCDFRTNRKDNLVNHIQAKHLLNDSNLNCKKCGRINFSSIATLRNHLRICSLSEDQKNALKRHCCNQCSYKTLRKAHLTEHIQAKHQARDPNLNKCEKCKKSYSYRSYLKQHSCSLSLLNPKLSTKSFSCNDCDFKTGWKISLVKHIKNKHLYPDLKNCNKCGKNFAPYNFSRHLNYCGLPRVPKLSRHLTCDDCKIEFNRKNSLILHIKTKHLPPDLSIKCKKCAKTFAGRSYLKIHSKICGLPKDLTLNKCKKCGKSYSQKSGLTSHSKICGLPSSPKLKNLSCDHCDFKTYCKDYMVRHMQVKHLPIDSNSIKCGKCAKKFTNQYDLSKHLKICGLPPHLMPKKFSCDHCEFKTHLKPSLVNHIHAKHLPKDPNLNKCNKCGKNFSQPGNLLRHSKICNLPEGTKPPSLPKRFFCDHCDHKSDSKGHLTVHIRTMHLPPDPSLYRCSKCGKIYVQRGNLLSHQKNCGTKRELKRLPKIFSCEHCVYKCATQKLLRKHTRSKHFLDVTACNDKSQLKITNLWHRVSHKSKLETLKKSLIPCTVTLERIVLI